MRRRGRAGGSARSRATTSSRWARPSSSRAVRPRSRCGCPRSRASARSGRSPKLAELGVDGIGLLACERASVRLDAAGAEPACSPGGAASRARRRASRGAPGCPRCLGPLDVAGVPAAAARCAATSTASSPSTRRRRSPSGPRAGGPTTSVPSPAHAVSLAETVLRTETAAVAAAVLAVRARGTARAARRNDGRQMNDCLFCRIVRGEVPSTKVAESEVAYAFRDVAPVAPVHVLVVPKAHVTSAHEVGPRRGAPARRAGAARPGGRAPRGDRRRGPRLPARDERRPRRQHVRAAPAPPRARRPVDGLAARMSTTDTGVPEELADDVGRPRSSRTRTCSPSCSASATSCCASSSGRSRRARSPSRATSCGWPAPRRRSSRGSSTSCSCCSRAASTST